MKDFILRTLIILSMAIIPPYVFAQMPDEVAEKPIAVPMIMMEEDSHTHDDSHGHDDTATHDDAAGHDDGYEHGVDDGHGDFALEKPFSKSWWIKLLVSLLLIAGLSFVVHRLIQVKE